MPSGTRPTVIDTTRGVKNDFKKLGVSLVSTIKSARHSAGHLGFQSSVQTFRKNLGVDEKGALRRMREGLTTEESKVPRPGVFIDADGNLKYPVLTKIKSMTHKTTTDTSEQSETDAPDVGAMYGRDLEANTDLVRRNRALSDPNANQDLIKKPARKETASLLGSY